MRAVLAALAIPACGNCATFVQPAQVNMVGASSIVQPFEVWHDKERGVTCYRVPGDGISCFKSDPCACVPEAK